MFIDDYPGNQQPNIHPGSIPSTGRTSSSNHANQLITAQYTQNGVMSGLSSPLSNNLNHMFGGLTNGLVTGNVIMSGTPTSTQNVAQQQLIGGAISPSLITIQAAAVAQHGQHAQILPVLHPAVIAQSGGVATVVQQQHQQQQPQTVQQQVSVIANTNDTTSGSSTPSNSSTNSGEVNKAAGQQSQLQHVQPAAAPVSFIDAPMLSAMQQMFTTMDHHHPIQTQHHQSAAGVSAATAVVANNNATTPIYFN